MSSRNELQGKLEELLKSKHVYYNPPSTLKMEYPCIRYSLKVIKSRFANSAPYSLLPCYELIVIAKESDHEVIKDLMMLPYCTHVNHYKADNLNHDVLTIHW